MRKILCLLILMYAACTVQGQELFNGKASKAYVLKYKNKEKLEQGKHQDLKWLRKTHVQIKDGGKTILINDKKYHKTSLHYIKNSGKIYGLNNYKESSWSNEQNWKFNYEINEHGFFVVIREKQGDKFVLSVYHLGERNHFFDVIKKNSIPQ